MARIPALASISLLLLASLPAYAADPLSVYTDSLGSGWQNWSWDTTVNLANTSPVHGASGKSIATTYTSAWAGLYLHTDTRYNAADHASLSFWIHGGTSGGQSIRVAVYDDSSGIGSWVTISPPAAGAWSNVQIPVASFGISTLNAIVWQETRGTAQPAYYLDDVQFTPAGPQPPGSGPVISIDAALNRHAISPYIYGMCFADPALATELHLPVNRWGGNAATRYNWKLDTSNRASDWFFENIPNDNSNSGQLPNGSDSDQFVEQNLSTGTDSLITVPLIGWTPKSRAYACGFSVTKYGPQQSTDQWRPDCGNGNHTDGTPITGNDPTDTSTAINPTFVTDWITHLTSRYGSASQGGVRFYDLDNEPMLWNSTHRDVHPNPTTYDEMYNRTLQYASAIKAADPAALTLGPVLWGWCAYFYSALDNCAHGSDYAAHGNTHFVPWYLQQMRDYEQSHGIRILDYLDLHYYPQASNVSLSSAGSSAIQALRLRSTRALWDPTYADESWISQVQDGPYVRLIPRMKDWVNANYPGTKLALTEYNWGGLESINGALAQADVLGIFGREGVDLATIWGPPSSAQPGAFAFRMYRNFDGIGSQFGQMSVKATSADQARVSVYAALRPDAQVTVMLINKTGGALTSDLSMANFFPGPQAAVFRYSPADLNHIIHEADLPLSGSTTPVTLPANSITLLVVPALLAPADFDKDLDVDEQDLTHLQGCFTGPNAGPPSAGCRNADLDSDGDVDQSDFGLFQRCVTAPQTPANPACVN